jgi:hypothetical protein
MALVQFPPALIETVSNFRIDERNRSGGASINGREQVVGSMLGRWLADMTYPLNNRARALAHRALLTRLHGRLNWVAVPYHPGKLAPTVLPLINNTIYPNNRLFLNNGQKYSDLGVKPVVAGDVQVRATTMGIIPGTTVGIEPGCMFSVNDRLYSIEDMTGNQLLISPVVRDFIPAGTPMEFWKPTCLMTLVTDDSGSTDLSFARIGSPAFQFVEFW